MDRGEGAKRMTAETEITKGYHYGMRMAQKCLRGGYPNTAQMYYECAIAAMGVEIAEDIEQKHGVAYPTAHANLRRLVAANKCRKYAIDQQNAQAL